MPMIAIVDEIVPQPVNLSPFFAHPLVIIPQRTKVLHLRKITTEMYGAATPALALTPKNLKSYTDIAEEARVDTRK